jgi:hypothetical protein
MDSWWQLGEGYGYQGNELQLYRITCPFCMESGNFKRIFHAEKKKPNSDKKGYVMVLWSASEHGFRPGIYSYEVLPWPLELEKYPEHWPEDIGRYWLQAKRNINGENWDAAVLMARSALQLALRNFQAQGKNLKQEIDDLAAKGLLPPVMKDWSGHVRELGNVAAHPVPSQGAPSPQDARDIIGFLDFLLEYLYDLPNQIRQYRERANKE